MEVKKKYDYNGCLRHVEKIEGKLKIQEDYSGNKVVCRTWWWDGKYPENGPAYQQFSITGDVVYQDYRKNCGYNYHRTDGPARIWLKNGKIIGKEFWIDGVREKNKDWFLSHQGNTCLKCCYFFDQDKVL